MIENIVTSYIKTMYINAHKQRLHWIYYTMLIGSLPLLIRFVVWLSVSDYSVLPIVVGDVVFWAMMINVATLYNISTAEDVPDLQVSVTAAVLVRLSLLVAIYSVALFPGISPHVLWIVIIILTALSVASSFLTTDSSYMHMQQQMYDLANNIQRLPASMQKTVRKHIERLLDGSEQVDIKAEIEKYLASYNTQIEMQSVD